MMGAPQQGAEVRFRHRIGSRGRFQRDPSRLILVLFFFLLLTAFVAILKKTFLARGWRHSPVAIASLHPVISVDFVSGNNDFVSGNHFPGKFRPAS